MKIYQLNKAVLRLTNNIEGFLQGLSSNTLDKSQNAFLTIHGRVIATFDQLKINDDEILVAVELPFVDNLIAHLTRYAKLSGVKLERTDFKTYFDLEGDYPVDSDDHIIPQKKGQLILTKKNLTANTADEEFKLFRLQNKIPVQGVDYTDEMILNVSEQDFVSFTKGCFLGQEPVSKVHNRSKPTWALVVKREDECDEEEKGKMTSKVLDPGSNKFLGFVFTRHN